RTQRTNVPVPRAGSPEAAPADPLRQQGTGTEQAAGRLSRNVPIPAWRNRRPAVSDGSRLMASSKRHSVKRGQHMAPFFILVYELIARHTLCMSTGLQIRHQQWSHPLEHLHWQGRGEAELV